ncbi:hypothetical protein B296_00016797 [Ensete ventricosum]|uniref:Uncharacterized protein n=1 Tax=Ensete ventricosum TaxID=4639 RepID=A0A427B5Q2_ENSVE|nr:hypothetical protein B296_00016797 [Ensete ventricosum]
MDPTIGWLWFLLCVLLIILKVLLFLLRFFNEFDHEKPPFLATMFAAPGLGSLPSCVGTESSSQVLLSSEGSLYDLNFHLAEISSGLVVDLN